MYEELIFEDEEEEEMFCKGFCPECNDINCPMRDWEG